MTRLHGPAPEAPELFIPPAVPTDPGELLLFLRTQEEWFRAVFEGAAMGIGIVNMEGRFIEANAAFLRMVGYDLDEVREMPFTSLNHPDDNARNVPLFRQLVAGKLSHYQMEKRYRCKDGSFLPVRLTTSVVRDAAGQPRFCVAMVEDITERHRAEAERRELEERLRHSALHDPLTGLPNRVLLMERLAAAVERCDEEEGVACAVLFLDLDRFKVINDSLGHFVGDQLLCSVANRLRECVRGTDTVARFGGDEFVILLDGTDASQAVAVAGRIQRELAAPFDLDGYEAFTTASIGVALAERPDERPEHLLRNADMAMYRAKGAGMAQCAVFDRSMHAAALERLQLETDLRHALQRGELRLHYQPLVHLGTGRVAALEALARWEHPEQGMISPARFIPVAEDTGMILPLGSWVLAEAARQLAEWRAEIPEVDALEVSVNVSPKQLRDPGLVEEIRALLEEHALPPRCLKLELTESSMLDDPAASAALLHRLKGMEVELYLDDFGTGYSSLSYLHQLPLNAIKIDRSFIHGLEGSPSERQGNTEIVRTIVTLARSLEVPVVAEGVETPEQLAALRELGCDYGQGYLFSRPVESGAARDLLLADPRW
ncbi:MAG: EAL domain-containing protein [Gemmatimonadetes bacterium]|nr:EAL domain-containing protein [Gemmatimonadota bacterium]